MPHCIISIDVKFLCLLLAKVHFVACKVSLSEFIKKSDRIADHRIAHNKSFLKTDFAKYPVGSDILRHKSKHLGYQMI